MLIFGIILYYRIFKFIEGDKNFMNVFFLGYVFNDI